ncbi:MAG: 30S ribosomal protein S3 [Candidatus Micrarchaeota archaeon]
MASEKKFLQKAMNDYEVRKFLEKQLERAGISSVQVQKTPVATRITLYVQRPGIVVGKKGTAIDELAHSLMRFGIENPKIEVVEVAVPSLDSKLMCEKIARQIEMRGNVKQAVRMTLREIMSAGAVGAEIRVAGKLVGKGGKAKTVTMRQGFLKKSGDPMKLVREAKYTAYPRAGAVGITVKILPPGVVLPDKIDVSKATLAEVAETPVGGATPEDADGKETEATETAPADADGEKPKRKPRKKAEKEAVDATPAVETPSAEAPAAEAAAEATPPETTQ